MRRNSYYHRLGCVNHLIPLQQQQQRRRHTRGRGYAGTIRFCACFGLWGASRCTKTSLDIIRLCPEAIDQNINIIVSYLFFVPMYYTSTRGESSDFSFFLYHTIPFAGKEVQNSDNGILDGRAWCGPSVIAARVLVRLRRRVDQIEGEDMVNLIVWSYLQRHLSELLETPRRRPSKWG